MAAADPFLTVRWSDGRAAFRFNCAWRATIPSLYLQRYVFWDVWGNSILLERTFACAGELSWTYAIFLGVRHVDTEIHTPSGTRAHNLSPPRA